MYNNLRFFNGLDTDLNLVKNDDGVWTGIVYLPEVSVQLYETVNLFILEECSHLYDVTPNTPVSENTDPTKFVFKWQKDVLAESKDFIMYTAQLKDGMYQIENLDTVEHDLIDNSVITGVDANGLKTISSKQNVALQVNIALSSLNEGFHRRTLLMYESVNGVETLVASIEFYGEVEGEDERLKSLLQNFGATLDEGDFLLFKEHDISEMSPDYRLLNQKRKELLLELHNIKPFVGTYKAILNAIDFFGYDRITLKEYWINIDKASNSFGKLYAIPVPNASKRGEMIRKKMRFKVPSSTTKKTSRFSLVYRLNEPNGTFDEWDIPNVDEVFDYTPDEVIIKLYGLKNKLQREYLPLNAKIVDITGEGDYFTQKNLNVWNIQNGIGFFSEGHDIKFEVFPKDRPIFIEDTSLVLKSTLDQDDPTNNYNLFLNMLPGTEDDLTEAERIELKQIYKNFYDDYHNVELHSYNQNIPIGAPVTLDGTLTFDDIWDEADFTWEDAVDANANLLVTWENWWKRWVYEVEWIVTNTERGYNQTFRGPIDDFLVLPLSLPYNGDYDVEFRTYDLFGHRSHYKKDNFINVKLKELELYGIYKWKEETDWNSKKLDWNKSGGYWNFPQDNSTLVEDDIATMYLTLDRANYVHLESDQGVRFSTVRRYLDIYSEDGFSETTGPYQWNECEFRWNDSKHLWWKAMRIGADLTASFKIDSIDNLDQLVIEHIDPITQTTLTGTHTIISPTPVDEFDIAGWTSIADELNASTDPVISKFNYNVVFEDTDGVNPLASDIFRFILAVGWDYSYTYDFSNVSIIPIIPGSDSNVSGETHVVHYNPTWDDTRVFKSFAEVERSTHVTISTDISKFPGSKNAIWRIQNITNPEITDIYYNNMWLTYIFQHPGYYSIELEAEDTYGNKNVVKRNMLKVK